MNGEGWRTGPLLGEGRPCEDPRSRQAPSWNGLHPARGPGRLTHFLYSSSVILRQKVSRTRRSSFGCIRPVLFTSMRLRARTTTLMFFKICT